MTQPESNWITINADRVLYLDEGREKVLCDRLPSPVTIVVKLAIQPANADTSGRPPSPRDEPTNPNLEGGEE